jgi:hypothetical protein
MQLEMPPMCATCGAAEASHLREIKEWGARTATANSGGILGVVVDEVASEAFGNTRYRAAQRRSVATALREAAVRAGGGPIPPLCRRSVATAAG